MTGPEPFTGPPPPRTPRSLFSLADLPTATLHRLVERSCDLYHDPGAHDDPLRRRLVGVLFTRTSTRTRTAFTAGALRLGAQVVTYGPGDLQTNTGESLEDTARVFGMMLDALVMRTSGPLAEMRRMADAGGLPVINAMAAEEHPTQGVCDLATMRLHRGTIEKTRLLYVGEGNNSATALAQGLSHFPGAELTFLTPPGYGLPERVRREAADRAAATGGTLREIHRPEHLPAAVDVVYTTRWQTTGTSKPDPGWREAFRPLHIDAEFLAAWPQAMFMHDLPAHRGEEVTGEVLDGKQSIAWSQSRMKLCSAMAVLEHVLSGPSHGRH